MMESSQAVCFVNFANLVDYVRNLFSSSENFIKMQTLTRFTKDTKFTKRFVTAHHSASKVNRKGSTGYFLPPAG
jgi:hypothetical protein